MSDLPRDLRVKAGMIMMCERIPFGSDAALMELAANEIDQLQQRNAELAAQVELLEAFKDEVIGVMSNSQGVSGWHLNGDVASWDELLPDIPESTPAQCLAEHDREVAARAGKAAYLHALNKYARSMPNCAFLDAAEQYANKIKSGEVEI